MMSYFVLSSNITSFEIRSSWDSLSSNRYALLWLEYPTKIPAWLLLSSFCLALPSMAYQHSHQKMRICLTVGGMSIPKVVQVLEIYMKICLFSQHLIDFIFVFGIYALNYYWISICHRSFYVIVASLDIQDGCSLWMSQVKSWRVY